MKPNFALTLSFEGIGLLHRAFPGWHMVGEVSLDSADLAEALADIRKTAEQLDTNPIRSKLVVPNDQIRFLHFDSEGLEADEIADAVHRELKGATPYAVDDLAYDWSIGAGQVYVAAVARETLAEAEAFATDHGFNPMCFVATPETRDFVGEPWFGETKAAATLLPASDRIERDTAAIRVIGTATLPTATPADAVPDPDQDPQPDTPPEPEIPPTPQPDTPPEPEIPPTPQPGTPPEPEIPPTPQPDTPPEPEIPPTPQPDVPPEPRPQPEPEQPPTPESAAVAFSSIRARRDDMPAAAPRLSGATRAPTAPSTDVDAPPKDDTPADPPLTTAPPSPPENTDQVTGTPQDALSVEAAARIGAALRPTDADRIAVSAEDDANTGDDIPPPPAFMTDSLERAQDSALPDEDAGAAPTAGEPGGAPSFSTRRRQGKRRLSLRSTARSTPEADLEQEKQRMTVFGARKSPAVGGKPRFLGLLLTAVLLIFLVGVAAWASIFLEDGIARILRDGPERVDEELATTPDAEIEEPAIAPQPDTTGTGDTVVAALPDITSDVDEDPRAVQPDPDPAELTEQQARARYAVTGIWQRAPDAPGEPAASTLDDFYLTSIDPKVLEQDAIALPDPGTYRGDARPDTPADPPAADTMFSMDTRGLVRAVPQGAITPDGVRVFAGKPALIPPRRPEETLAEPAEDPAATAERSAQTERLATIRPRPRPGDLAETNERETLGGRTRNELATLRPRLRPQSAQQLAEQAAAASTANITPDPDAVEAALQAAATAPPPDPFAGATQQAVRVSVKPNPRPRNFDRIVRRSKEQAEQQATRTAAVAVPRSQRVEPSGPTPTTVARAATEKNALKLRRVNLIGVYGTASNRRALVRLANGRYKKVKVGDRLDGGRVAAIGNSELRYVKSGRSVTLKMPRG